jgi:DNA mismatch repair protein MutL
MPASLDAGTIQKLPQGLINQIAAGEVIARPAAAVKELVENALDAGATRIEITVEEDARGFSVRDDGCGISAADARPALERHATSKIREFEDLHRLSTRGFRGEALAAIAGVSRFELITRREADEAGTRVRCEGGKSPRVTATGAPPGTTITVRDLFFNTPARLKFLRTPTVEWGYILKSVIRQALTRPDVAFSIAWRGRPFLNLPAGQTLRERLMEVLPDSAGIELLEIDETIQGVRAWGCIGSPKSTRRDRRHQYYFANGRPIVARPLTFALQEAYRGLIMTQQFPVAAVFLELAGEDLDVNVHPTKEEVRFRNESLAAGAIHRAALAALRRADLVPRFEWTQSGGAGATTREAAREHSVPEFFRGPEAALARGESKAEAPALGLDSGAGRSSGARRARRPGPGGRIARRRIRTSTRRARRR